MSIALFITSVLIYAYATRLALRTDGVRAFLLMWVGYAAALIALTLYVKGL